eukprot:GHVS01014805.1.p1 GENE.GHVS01014805.1~~GHVS01014805.1.p1  ORF type:complete len:201 (-),score=42.80 GHVS01014805.1:414-1016(-)
MQSPPTHAVARSVTQQCEETLESTLRVASEANQIADATSYKLLEQSEIVRSIERHSEDISHNLDTSQYLLNGMKSWWSTVTHLFTAPPSPPSLSPPSTPATAAVQQQRQSPQTANKSSSRSFGVGSSSGDSRSAQLDQKMSEGLDQLSGMLGDMHHRALEMNDQISQQNQSLESIHNQVDDNNARISKQKTQMNDLMRKW